MRINTITTSLALLIFVAACASQGVTDKAPGDTVIDENTHIKVYKSTSCGCCNGYISYLESNGFHVEVEALPNIDGIKQKYNIPNDMLSCHTATIGNYFVEGHVPVEAIKKVMTEKPAIDGIALPGMPAGSPGMGGTKQGKWQIYSIIKGTSTPYTTI